MPATLKKEIETLSPEERNSKLKELSTELMKQRAQVAMGTSSKTPSKVRQLRRAIARIKQLNGGLKK